MTTLVVIYLAFYLGEPPRQERVEITLPSIYECEAMRKQQAYLPAPSAHRVFVGSYCVKG
jgi:hypothetical protein